MSPKFIDFGSPAHLQLCCVLIQKHPQLVRQWVEEKTFLRNYGSGLTSLTPEKHRAAIQWLREQQAAIAGGGVDTVSTLKLMFWAVRDHFNALYEMVLCNACHLDMALSATTIGLVFCPELSMFNHDCVPNAYLKQTPTGYTVIALEPIQCGDEICISYFTEAVGLISLQQLDRKLSQHYGFHCKCPTHLGTRPLYRKKVETPTSLAVLYYKNRLLEAEMSLLDMHYKNGDWEKVRQICELLGRGFFPLIKSEARLAFAVSYCYVMTVPYCVPTNDCDKWLLLFTYVVTQYCTNPAFVARAFFFHLLHTVRKMNIIAFNPATGAHEHVFPGCHGTDLDVFLINYINLRHYVRRLSPTVGSPQKEDAVELILLESHLFGGLYSYLSLMETMVQDTEREIAAALGGGRKSRNESCNLTTCNVAIYLANELIDGSHLRKIALPSESSLLDVQEIDQMILEANYQNHPEQFPSRPPKKKSSKKKKKESKMQKVQVKKKKKQKKLATESLQLNVLVPGAYWKKIPDTAGSDEDDYIFYPAQVDME